MSGRITLPERRRLFSTTVEWRLQSEQVKRFDVSFGLDPNTHRIVEVFAHGERYGTDTFTLLSDACVVISIALQHGIQPAELIKSVSGSLIGVVLQSLVEEQRAIDEAVAAARMPGGDLAHQ